MTKPQPARAAATTILASYEVLIGRANVADSGVRRAQSIHLSQSPTSLRTLAAKEGLQ
jgi:hypothetical protein